MFVGRALVAASVVLLPLACSSAEKASPAPSTEAVSVSTTACAPSWTDTARTVKIRIRYESDSIGSFGTQKPSSILSGAVHFLLDMHPSSRKHGDAQVHKDTAEGPVVAEIHGVQPGQLCGIDSELAAGHYVVTTGLRDDWIAELDVVDS
jgi:hypothetical protein